MERASTKLSAKDEAAAAAILESLTGDLDTPIDPAAAQERVTAALRAVDALQKQSELAEAAKVRIEAARGGWRLFLSLIWMRPGPMRRCLRTSPRKKALALKLKAEYEAALADYKTSVSDRDTAIAHAEDAQAQATLRAELERQIQESHVEPPSADALSDAASELEAAKASQAKAAQQQVMAQQRGGRTP